MPEPKVIPAYLGWANPQESDSSFRLYARDVDEQPRWDRNHPGGRTIEHACPPMEGDRYLVVRIGDRFVDKVLNETELAEAIEQVIAEHIGSSEAQA